MLKGMTFYHVLWGVGVGHLIGTAGSALGYLIGSLITPIPKDTSIPKGVFYAQLLGGGLAHTGSLVMGIKVRGKPEVKTIGTAQAIYSGLGIAVTAVSAALGHYLLDENDATQKFRFIAPPMLIGKPITKARGKGEPRDEIERARQHEPQLTANLSDNEVADMLKRRAIVLPKPGTGYLIGRAAQ